MKQQTAYVCLACGGVPLSTKPRAHLGGMSSFQLFHKMLKLQAHPVRLRSEEGTAMYAAISESAIKRRKRNSSSVSPARVLDWEV